jgi:hypothetical protein
MAYDLEYNDAVVEQCKSLSTSQSYDDWRLFCEIVLSNMDDLMTLSLLKIIKVIDAYSSTSGNAKHTIPDNISTLFWGSMYRRSSKPEETVLKHGFHKLLIIEVDMREWKKGKTHKHDPRKAGGKNKL